MISVIEINGRDIPAEVYGVAHNAGQRVVSLGLEKTGLIYSGATIIAMRLDADNARVLVILPVQGFLSKPRSEDFDYKLIDDTTAIALMPSDTEWTVDPATPVAGADGVIPPMPPSSYLYGNIDWIGVNTAAVGELSDAPILSFKGPSGRLIGLDRHIGYPEYALWDEDVGIDTYYTCFGPNVYQGGELLFTLPRWGTYTTDTPVKVLAVALYNEIQVVVCNVNFREVPNPSGGVGGFFEFLLIQVDIGTEKTEADKNPFETAGWRVLWFRQAGGPTDIWGFNASGSVAVKGIEKLTLSSVTDPDTGVVTYSAVLSERGVVYGTGNEAWASDGSRSFWNKHLTAAGFSFYDFLQEAEKAFAIGYRFSEDSTWSMTSDSVFRNVPIGRVGAATLGTYTCYIGVGSGANSFLGNLIYLSGGAEAYVGCGVLGQTVSWSYDSYQECKPDGRRVDTIRGTILLHFKEGNYSCSATKEIVSSSGGMWCQTNIGSESTGSGSCWDITGGWTWCIAGGTKYEENWVGVTPYWCAYVGCNGCADAGYCTQPAPRTGYVWVAASRRIYAYKCNGSC
jgi:hypothetical protein